MGRVVWGSVCAVIAVGSVWLTMMMRMTRILLLLLLLLLLRRAGLGYGGKSKRQVPIV